jgi:hypothetical protein
MDLQLDPLHRLNQLGFAFVRYHPSFFTTLVGDTLRLFKVEVVGAMVSNILAFVWFTT